MAQTQAPANTGQVVLGWVWVGIPLLWGVIQTCINVAKLFQ
jgi:hypothetical protein